MSRFGEKKKLAELSLSLIKEYEQLASEIREIIEDVQLSADYENIVIKDEDGEEQYHLSELFYYYEEEQESGDFTYAIRELLEEEDIKEQFEELDKKEFIDYVGNLYYAKYRSKEIYKELKRISNKF